MPFVSDNEYALANPLFGINRNVNPVSTRVVRKKYGDMSFLSKKKPKPTKVVEPTPIRKKYGDMSFISKPKPFVNLPIRGDIEPTYRPKVKKTPIAVTSSVAAANAKTLNTANMNKAHSLSSGFLNKIGLSGGVTFGQNQKLVNLAFWVIAGVVLVLIIRPFDFLSRRKRRR